MFAFGREYGLRVGFSNLFILFWGWSKIQIMIMVSQYSFISFISIILLHYVRSHRIYGHWRWRYFMIVPIPRKLLVRLHEMNRLIDHLILEQHVKSIFRGFYCFTCHSFVVLLGKAFVMLLPRRLLLFFAFFLTIKGHANLWGFGILVGSTH